MINEKEAAPHITRRRFIQVVSAGGAGAAHLRALSGAETASRRQAEDQAPFYDVFVYGGTSAGIAAAVQVARMGRSVFLVEPSLHLGGLTTGGLGRTDIGNEAVIGGIAREFYRRLGRHYGADEMWTFEPHVASQAFLEMLQEAEVTVRSDQRLAGVEKTGNRIRSVRMEDGTVYRAQFFIDATYEGDLMARAGVSYAVGREPNSEYGERLNGVANHTPYHNFVAWVDPYIEPGDPDSGLLPLIQSETIEDPTLLPREIYYREGGVAGEGDHRVQAYNFRLCLTQDPENRVAIEPPPDYDQGRFELLGRYFDALRSRGFELGLRDFLIVSMMPNGKTDMNNRGAFSTDYIGGNWDYPEADYRRRAEIWKDHENYTRGFLHYLATSPRVPENVRKEMQSWGLTKDEFKETDGWPPQLYIREARRMIGSSVMTERNCRGTEKAPDPVGMGAYNMDSHNVQRVARRYAITGRWYGRVDNEGDVQVGLHPYPISYRSIVPKQEECENLLVPVCLSSSHIAFGSIRMEPVFMILGQSAATAAVHALEQHAAVQRISYPKLRERLEADAQILHWERPD